MPQYDIDLEDIVAEEDISPYSNPGSQIANNKKYRRALTGWVDAYPLIKEYIERLPLGIPVHSAKLEKMFNTSGASVRKCTTEMLYKGILVCSNEDGYYKPKDRAQALECTQHLESRRDALNAKVIELHSIIDKTFPHRPLEVR